jgi:hypothetical protein
MAITQNTYFLDAATLVLATCVYLDNDLNVIATDGFYSDGVVTRELISGVLQPFSPCAICGDNCRSGNVNFYSNALSAVKGLYEVVFKTNDEGAIIIAVNDTSGFPLGIRAQLDNGVYANQLSCNYDGAYPENNLIRSASTIPTDPVFFGDRAQACTNSFPFGALGSTYGCSTATTQLYSTNNYIYDYLLGAFVSTPPTVNWTVNANTADRYGVGDVDMFTPGDPITPWSPSLPRGAVMVLSRSLSDSDTVRLFLYGFSDVSYFDISVVCPQTLPYVAVTNRQISSALACTKPLNYNLYFVSVSTFTFLPPFPTTLGINDWVFTDSKGKNLALDGYYGIGGNQYIQVKDGRVIVLDSCLP